MAKETFRVTDHALIRYLERAMGLNVEIVRQHIQGICEGPAAVGAVSVRAEGVRFEIRNNTVLTVAPDRSNPSNTGRAMVQDHIQRKKREQQIQPFGIRPDGVVYDAGGSAGREPIAVPEPGAAGFGDTLTGDPAGDIPA